MKPGSWWGVCSTVLAHINDICCSREGGITDISFPPASEKQCGKTVAAILEMHSAV